jgi:glycerol-3-phosphate dehydrogenase
LGDEMRRREPEINPAVSGALWAYTGGVVDPFNATIAAAENALRNGVKLALNTAFVNFILDEKKIVGIKTNRGDFGCHWVVNAAGLYADEVMHKAGVRPDFYITPRRGEYFVLDRSEIAVNNVLFPVPTDKGKGILVTGTTHGNPIVGPTSVSLNDKEDRSSTPEGQEELWQGARKLVPSLKMNYVISSFVGLRATGNAMRPLAEGGQAADFIIEIPGQVQGLVNLGGIESPGLTSAPAIAQRVVDLLKDAGLPLAEKHDWDPIRPPRPRFCEMERAEQALLVAMDPRYGRVICRCEMVTEGEIVAEIHAPIPAITYDAIKRRTWLGTGRCLGSFDTPRVVSILAEELGVSPLAITKKGPGSEFLVRETKSLEV